MTADKRKVGVPKADLKKSIKLFRHIKKPEKIMEACELCKKNPAGFLTNGGELSV